MKKKNDNTSNYLYYNPNPKVKYKKDGTPYKWHIGDCTTRALCGATGLSWLEVFDLQCKLARERCTPSNDEGVVEEILAMCGFTPMSIKVTRGSVRPTVRELAKKYVGYRGLVQVANHDVCIDDGVYKDVWDSGYKPAYKFFIKKIER